MMRIRSFINQNYGDNVGHFAEANESWRTSHAPLVGTYVNEKGEVFVRAAHLDVTPIAHTLTYRGFPESTLVVCTSCGASFKAEHVPRVRDVNCRRCGTYMRIGFKNAT